MMFTPFIWLGDWWKARKARIVREAKAYAFLLTLPDHIADVEGRLAAKQAEFAAVVAERLEELETRLTEIEGRLGGRLIARVPSMREIQDRADGKGAH